VLVNNAGFSWFGPTADLIRRYLAEVEPLLRASATMEIDASAPLPRVVRQLEEPARSAAGG
jgi:hypothetical protein